VDFTTIFIIGAVIILAIFVLIMRLALRWIIRLVIIGVILVAIAGAGAFYWWSDRLVSEPPARRPKPARTTPSR
jgi:hypothetical protein